jgi:high affinity Mn2+ porin
LGGGHSDWQANGTGGVVAPLSGSLDLFEGFKPFHGTGGYFDGLQGGYNWMLTPRWLAGVEADVSFPSAISATSRLSSPAIGQARFTDTAQMFGTVRGRLGVVTGSNWLVYATAGLAWSYDELRRSQDVGTPIGGTALPGDNESLFKTRIGWAAGAGVEIPVAPGWTAKFEYQYAGFPQHAASFAAGAQRFESDLSLHSLRAGLNRKIDLGSAEALKASSTGIDADWGSIHGQATYVHQFTPSFRSPYRGQNSFIPNQGRETADVTIYAGFRLWSGAELWINPEIDQGFGLSGTLGVAGFVSGEAYKVGMSAPYTRMQRYFIRQTIDLGGDKEKVEADVNQFGGTQSSNRVVLTIGKLAVPDIFDTNKYAHDARKDFMNWTLLDTGSFDYAADAWGYTYGAAAEWYQGPWTVRAGIFDLSIVPNSTELDASFRQFQIVGEIERRYDLWGRPGKVAVTGFLTRGRMGSFADAVLQANLLGEAADTANVRRYRSRAGFAFNLEQELVENVGFFMRAGLASGNVEPYEFTDVDTTVAAGLSFSGKQWGRPEDTFGVAGVVNQISDAHKAYLNAGGLGILVGDGRLPNPASEQILEMYYSFPVLTLKMTFDYQFIVNPGYNRDRGPASVFGTRLRAQF